MLPAVPGQVALTVAVNVEPADPAGTGHGSLKTPVKTVLPCQGTFFGKPMLTDNNVPTCWSAGALASALFSCGSLANVAPGSPVVIVTMMVGLDASAPPAACPPSMCRYLASDEGGAFEIEDPVDDVAYLRRHGQGDEALRWLVSLGIVQRGLDDTKGDHVNRTPRDAYSMASERVTATNPPLVRAAALRPLLSAWSTRLVLMLTMWPLALGDHMRDDALGHVEEAGQVHRRDGGIVVEGVSP